MTNQDQRDNSTRDFSSGELRLPPHRIADQELVENGFFIGATSKEVISLGERIHQAALLIANEEIESAKEIGASVYLTYKATGDLPVINYPEQHTQFVSDLAYAFSQLTEQQELSRQISEALAGQFSAELKGKLIRPMLLLYVGTGQTNKDFSENELALLESGKFGAAIPRGVHQDGIRIGESGQLMVLPSNIGTPSNSTISLAFGPNYGTPVLPKQLVDPMDPVLIEYKKLFKANEALLREEEPALHPFHPEFYSRLVYDANTIDRSADPMDLSNIAVFPERFEVPQIGQYLQMEADALHCNLLPVALASEGRIAVRVMLTLDMFDPKYVQASDFDPANRRPIEELWNFDNIGYNFS
jgi:hypothetical protein